MSRVITTSLVSSLAPSGHALSRTGSDINACTACSDPQVVTQGAGACP